MAPSSGIAADSLATDDESVTKTELLRRYHWLWDALPIATALTFYIVFVAVEKNWIHFGLRTGQIVDVAFTSADNRLGRAYNSVFSRDRICKVPGDSVSGRRSHFGNDPRCSDAHCRASARVRCGAWRPCGIHCVITDRHFRCAAVDRSLGAGSVLIRAALLYSPVRGSHGLPFRR